MLTPERLARIRADVDNYHDSMSEKRAAVVAAHIPALLAEITRLRHHIAVQMAETLRQAAVVPGCACPVCNQASDEAGGLAGPAVLSGKVEGDGAV